jgi:hypothetical protein
MWSAILVPIGQMQGIILRMGIKIYETGAPTVKLGRPVMGGQWNSISPSLREAQNEFIHFPIKVSEYKTFYMAQYRHTWLIKMQNFHLKHFSVWPTFQKTQRTQFVSMQCGQLCDSAFMSSTTSGIHLFYFLLVNRIHGQAFNTLQPNGYYMYHLV